MEFPLFEQIEYWHWGIAAALFLLLELFVSGAFFLFIGASAFIVGAITLILPISWVVQFAIWGLLSLGTTIGWRIWRKDHPPANSNTTLNKRGHQYVDRTFTIGEPIVNGYGKIKVDDSIWKIECETDHPEGTKVKITGVDGVLLKAEKA